MFFRLACCSLLTLLVSCQLESPQERESIQRRQVTNANRTLQDENAQLRNQRDALKREREGYLGARRDDLRNPSWQELSDFLLNDQTDTLEYVARKFDCNGFAQKLRDNAFLLGIRSAYVFVEFEGKAVGHALNKFKLDTGEMVYIDNTQRDQIAYVEMGKHFITLTPDVLRRRYMRCANIDCHFVVEEYFGGDLFSFAYAELYLERMNAFNANVDRYNSSFDRTKLRRDNLERVQTHLGPISNFSDDNIVSNIEEYWN